MCSPHTSMRVPVGFDIEMTLNLAMELFISLTKKGVTKVQVIYTQYGRSGVLPNGQNHKPRLCPSRK